MEDIVSLRTGLEAMNSETFTHPLRAMMFFFSFKLSPSINRNEGEDCALETLLS